MKQTERLILVLFILCLLGCSLANGQSNSESNAADSGQPPSEKEDGTKKISLSPSYKFLQKAVENTRNQEGYHLESKFVLSSSNRKDDLETQSKGVFKRPSRYRLKSQTPSGMVVTSYGIEGTIAHIHPSTDQIVTSDELGISTISRRIQDPFEHFKYLMKPDYPGFSCTFGEKTSLDDLTYRVVRVSPGKQQIQEVMAKFQEQMQKKLDPEQTQAVYNVWIDEKKKLIRKIGINIKARELEDKKQSAENQGSDGNSGDGGKDNWKEKIEKKTNKSTEKSSESESEAEIQISGSFTFDQYNQNLDVSIPEDVKDKLQEWKKEK